jgi:predicted transcriptional regulator
MAKSVRVPDDLYAEVQKLAAKEERSISNMVAVLLRKALEQK